MANLFREHDDLWSLVANTQIEVSLNLHSFTTEVVEQECVLVLLI